MPGNDAQLTVEGSNPKTVEEMLHFIYTGGVSESMPDVAVAVLLELAIQYELDDLADFVAALMVDSEACG